MTTKKINIIDKSEIKKGTDHQEEKMIVMIATMKELMNDESRKMIAEWEKTIEGKGSYKGKQKKTKEDKTKKKEKN